MISHYAFDPALSPELEIHVHQEALHLHLMAVSNRTHQKPNSWLPSGPAPALGLSQHTLPSFFFLPVAIVPKHGSTEPTARPLFCPLGSTFWDRHLFRWSKLPHLPWITARAVPNSPNQNEPAQWALPPQGPCFHCPATYPLLSHTTSSGSPPSAPPDTSAWIAASGAPKEKTFACRLSTFH